MGSRRVVLLVLALVACAQTVHANQCRDTLPGPHFFNGCRIENPPNAMADVATVVQQWVNPRSLVIYGVLLLLVAPLLMLGGPLTHNADVLQRYATVKLHALNFIHRVNYSLVLGVALYTVFRQHRPCECWNGELQEYVQVGSVYGMPSGDAMGAAVFGAFLLEYGPFYPIWGRVMGGLWIALVCFERQVLGFHTLGQVLTGTLIGVLGHFYSTRAPQMMVFVDAFVQCVGGLILVLLDSNSTTRAFPKQDNLVGWIIWGIGFEIFVCLMLWRHYSRSLGGKNNLKLSLVTIMKQSKADTEERLVLNEFLPHNDLHDEQLVESSDINYTLACFGFLCVWNLLSFMAATFRWFA